MKKTVLILLVLFIFITLTGYLLSRFNLPTNEKQKSSSETSTNKEAFLGFDKETVSQTIGQTLEVVVATSSGQTSINTVEAKIIYPSDFLELTNIDTENSFVKIWFLKANQKEKGLISLTGSLPAPGIKTANSPFAKLVFRALKSGNVEISFSKESQVYDNQNSSPILKKTKALRVSITE